MWIVLHLCTGFQLLHLFFQYPAEIVRFPAGYVSSPKGCQLQVSCPKIFTRFGEKKSGCEISHFNLNLHITLGCFKNKHIVPPPLFLTIFSFFGGFWLEKRGQVLKALIPWLLPHLTSNERWPEANSPGPSVPIASKNRRFFIPGTLNRCDDVVVLEHMFLGFKKNLEICM